MCIFTSLFRAQQFPYSLFPWQVVSDAVQVENLKSVMQFSCFYHTMWCAGWEEILTICVPCPYPTCQGEVSSMCPTTDISPRWINWPITVQVYHTKVQLVQLEVIDETGHDGGILHAIRDHVLTSWQLINPVYVRTFSTKRAWNLWHPFP